jgi:ribulose 1,5-bisphosphate carboxylase large subunit-like protein
MVQVAEMYQKEVVRLQERADTHDEEITQLRTRHAQEISELKAQHAVALQQAESKWRAVHAEDQTRISQLEHQVEVLYQRLYASDPPQ